MDKRHSVDQAYLRRVNQRSVLGNVFENGISSRARIAKELSMSKPAIADNLRDLIELGILIEIGEGDTTPSGGRKPRLIRFNESHRHIIAIDLNYKEPILALCDLRGKILKEASFSVPGGASESDCAKALAGAVRALMAQGADKRGIAAIAVCSPGVFDRNGKALSWNPGFFGVQWCMVDYVALLENEFGIKVLVKNDVKAAAIGEWASAYKKRADNMLLFSVGVGAGVGLILDSKPYEGERFSSGEIYGNTDPAKFAQNKTFEHEVCMAALQRRVKEGAESGAFERGRAAGGSGEIGFEEIVAAYESGDGFILSLIESIALEIGCTLANAINLLDIRHVVIAGEYLAFKDVLLKQIEQVFSKYCRGAPELRASVLGRYQGIYGLAHIVREWYFDQLCRIDPEPV